MIIGDGQIDVSSTCIAVNDDLVSAGWLLTMMIH